MWIALFFSVISMAAMYRQKNDMIQPGALPSLANEQNFAHVCREKVAQCLILGDYTRGPPLAVEVLLVYLYSEYMQSPDSHAGYWILLGVIVRLALRMGYHRDGSQIKSLTPFQSEMRRRVWSVILELDVISASQFGLPRMIRDQLYDTAEPHNLFDHDLDEDMTELPPSRPEIDLTPIQFVCEKNKIFKVYGTIIDSLTGSQAPSYEEILRLDILLQETYNELPARLHMRPLAQSIMDGPEIIRRRFLISIAYQRAQIVLHRKYLLPAHSEGRFLRSRIACIDAAMQITEYQDMISEECRPGGRFAQYAWRISSFLYEEFLLGTTILCIDLNCSIGRTLSALDVDIYQRVVPALQRSHQIWLGMCESSKEARKAARALNIVFSRLKSIEEMKNSDSLPSVTDDDSRVTRPERGQFISASRHSSTN